MTEKVRLMADGHPSHSAVWGVEPVNLTTTEMAVTEDPSDESHRVYLDAHAFEPASWSTASTLPPLKAPLAAFLAEFITKQQQAIRESVDVASRPDISGLRKPYAPVTNGHSIRIFEMYPSVPGCPVTGTMHEVSLEFEYPSTDPDGRPIDRTEHSAADLE